ncbi:MAG: FadR/GntR family transcriptional regulator [Rubrobacter sp.]
MLDLSGQVQREHLSYQVARRIAEQLATLSQGTTLPSQGEFVRSLEVSRPVVREAFKLLEAWGLIAMHQGRPAVVRDLDHSLLNRFFDLFASRRRDSMTQLLELRSIVEVGTVQLAAGRATATQLEALRSTLELMSDHRYDPIEFIDADISFHVLLAESSGNDMIATVTTALRAQLRDAQIITRAGASRREDDRLEALVAHERIYAAVEARDAEGASEAMRMHLRRTMSDLLSAYPEQDDSGGSPGEEKR